MLQTTRMVGAAAMGKHTARKPLVAHLIYRLDVGGEWCGQSDQRHYPTVNLARLQVVRRTPHWAAYE